MNIICVESSLIGVKLLSYRWTSYIKIYFSFTSNVISFNRDQCIKVSKRSPIPLKKVPSTIHSSHLFDPVSGKKTKQKQNLVKINIG